MRRILKTVINGALASINLKVSQVNAHQLSGIHLFDDLKVIINKDSPTCLDVGANIGQTIENLFESFPSPYIYSFEPSSTTFETLQSKNYNDRVVLNNFALGREPQTKEFINYSDPLLSSFLPMDTSEENRFRATPEQKREQVKVGTVDQFIKAQGLNKIDLLKIDTQGFDYDVLLGAQKSLSEGVIDNVLVEIIFVKMYEQQCSAEQIINLLAEQGLLLVDYYEKARQGHTLGWCTALFSRR